MVVIALSPAFSHCGANVTCRHFFLGYEHVAIIEPGAGSRALVEDHNGVLHLSVHEIQLEVGTNVLPHCTPPNRSVNGCGHTREGHPVFLKPMERKWLR